MPDTFPQPTSGSSLEATQIINQSLLHILERITDGFIALDNQWRLIYVNQHVLSWLGVKLVETLGRNIWDLLPYQVGSATYQHYHKARQTGQAVHFEEWFGKNLCTEQHVYPSADGLSIYIRDITERKTLERRKDEFISLASHELKTPVTTLKGFAQLLLRRLKKQGDTQTLDSVDRMVAQIDKLTLLINDLLDLSRIQSGKLIFREERFDLAELVAEIVENLRPALSTHQLHISSSTAAPIFGDRDRLGQVLINLLTNAVKYSPLAETVLISLTCTQQHATVSVQDFGPGIAADQQQQIFERFYQVAHNTHAHEQTGLGIGLSISYEIVQHHQGQMQVESAIGKGSTFSFTLPLAPAQDHIVP